MQNGFIKEKLEITPDVLAFVVFCIENLASKLELDPTQVYNKLAVDSDLLYSYIIPCYDSLHTQDKEYILNDLIEIMRKKGVLQ